MCHRRTFLQLFAGGAGLLFIGQGAEAAKTTKSKTKSASTKKAPKAAKPTKADKQPKVVWYAKIHLKDGVKLVGQFRTREDAIFQGNHWVSKYGRGATFYGETVGKELD